MLIPSASRLCRDNAALRLCDKCKWFKIASTHALQKEVINGPCLFDVCRLHIPSTVAVGHVAHEFLRVVNTETVSELPQECVTLVMSRKLPETL